MRIVQVSIRNFRGIEKLDWCPAPGMNCLIGPGDSTKTTILDAIELALNPRANFVGDDADFHNLVFGDSITITVTLVGMPTEFCAENRYGLHLRGWDSASTAVVDEPGDGLEDALSIRLTIDAEALEGRWSIFNDRTGNDSDPPALRYKDALQLATTRLGPYAERHLGWGRQSVLNRLGDGGKPNAQLAEASRAARDAFRKTDRNVFTAATEYAEKLGKRFGVRVRDKFAAELDVRGSVITTGGVSLHDDKLPLRTLGTGSSRLIVSALQHNAGGSHIALVDEIEHGLEPHRIARLLRYLSSPPPEEDGGQSGAAAPQLFITTHSPVVIRELKAEDIQTVRSTAGQIQVRAVAAAAETSDVAQRHLRSSPDAFLARRVLVGEGKTECGLMRGLDDLWSHAGQESFALRGVIPINGEGIPKALTIATHLLELGYDVLALLDSDEPPSEATLDAFKAKGGIVAMWPDACSTEERIFKDLPWAAVRQLVAVADDCEPEGSVLAVINNACRAAKLPELTDLSLPDAAETDALRAALGKAAKSTEKTKRRGWFKDIERAERVAEIVFARLDEIAQKPLAITIGEARRWVDG
jgi:putative ATP-dependent endonuclease of OLD family